MKRNIILAIIVCVVCILAGCTDTTDENISYRGNDVVEFIMDYPVRADVQGRSVEEKLKFENGDAIHVSAVFKLRTSNNPDSYETSARMYNCLIFKDGKWISTATDETAILKWPWNAVSGSFEAYYMPQTKAMLPEGESSTELLSGSYTDSDPLHAITREEVLYGRPVKLEFEHLCARLIVENTKSIYADEYWFHEAYDAQTLCNAYRLTHNSDHTLEFSFESQPDNNNGISSVKQSDGSVIFYLEPGNYKGARLNYVNDRPYLTLNVEDLANLEAGRSYRLDISSTQGIVEEVEEEDPWTEEEKKDPIKLDKFQIDAFLNAITHDQTYTVSEGDKVVDILTKDASGHLMLMENLDFGGKEYAPMNVPSTVVFHGKYHYISGLRHALFGEMAGRIDYLKLKNVNIEGLYDETKERVGALARYCSGYVNEVMLENVEIKIPSNELRIRAIKIGALVGELSGGGIVGVTLCGNIWVEAHNPAGKEANATLSIGGIIGESAGSLQKVSMKEDASGNLPRIQVVNHCTGTGQLSIGGLIGQLNSDPNFMTSGCFIHATVDASASEGNQVCAGGLVGRLEKGFVKDCNTNGEVLGGKAKTYSDVQNVFPGRSYAGGLTGYIAIYDVGIGNCNSFNDVKGITGYELSSESELKNKEAYGTGGGVGCVGSVACTIKDCMAWGTVTGVNDNTQRGYCGTFIGVCQNDAVQNEGNNTAKAIEGLRFYGHNRWEMIFNTYAVAP